ncbi:hypothetical protein QEN19_001758 [Hanseniaspora menglaensis]
MWFTLQQKVELYKVSKEHPHWTQEDIACWFQRTYHSLKQPSQTTVSRVLKYGEELTLKLEALEKAIKNGEPIPKKSIKKTTSPATGSKKRKSPAPAELSESSKKRKKESESPNSLLPLDKSQNSSVATKVPNLTTHDLSSLQTKNVNPPSSLNGNIAKRTVQNQLLRKILQEWIYQTSWNNIPITFPILKDTAASIWQKLPLEKRHGNGFFTYKWLVKFLKRCDIQPPLSSKQYIELNKPKKIWSFEERDLLKSFLMQIPKKDLFTLDETLLAYNLPADKTYYGISKLKKQIEIMTVMLCVNVDASEKQDPLCIGKYSTYQCFKEEFGEKQQFSNGTTYENGALYAQDILEKYGIEYNSNQESFLTSTMFHNWLVKWDNQLREFGRQIYIILDDCCSHRIMNVKLTNITLIYTRAQKKFLPFNWGIVDEFKTKYRQQQYEALIDLQNNIARINSSKKKEVLTFYQSKLNISNAFRLIKKSWDSISEPSLMSSWKASGILPPNYITLNKPISMGLKKSDIFLKILKRLQTELKCFSKWDPEMLLDLSIEHRALNFVSLQELIDFATVLPYEPVVGDILVEQNNEFSAEFSQSFNKNNLETKNDTDTNKNNLLSQQGDKKRSSITLFDNFQNSPSAYLLSPIEKKIDNDLLNNRDPFVFNQLDFQNDALDQEVLEMLNMTNFERQHSNNKKDSPDNLLNLNNNVSSNISSIEPTSLLQFNDLHNGITSNLQKGDLNINKKTGISPVFVKHENIVPVNIKQQIELDSDDSDEDNESLSTENIFALEKEEDNITPNEIAENKQIRSGIPILNNMTNSPENFNQFDSGFRERKDSLMQLFEYNGLDEFRQQLGGIGGYGASQPHLNQSQQVMYNSIIKTDSNASFSKESIESTIEHLQNTFLKSPKLDSNFLRTNSSSEFEMLKSSQQQEQAKKLLILLNNFISYQNLPSVLKVVDIKMSMDLQLELSKIYNVISAFLKSNISQENCFTNAKTLDLTKENIVTLLNKDPNVIKKLITELQEFVDYFKLPSSAQIYHVRPVYNISELEAILRELLLVLESCI